MGTRVATHSCGVALEIVNAQKTLANPEKGETVMACEYEYTPKRHKSISAELSGVCLCTLTGYPCLIDDPAKRLQCLRRLDINQWLTKQPVKT